MRVQHLLRGVRNVFVQFDTTCHLVYNPGHLYHVCQIPSSSAFQHLKETIIVNQPSFTLISKMTKAQDVQTMGIAKSGHFQVVDRSGKAKNSKAKNTEVGNSDLLMMPGGLSSLKELTLADYVVTGSQKERKAAKKAKAAAAANEKM